MISLTLNDGKAEAARFAGDYFSERCTVTRVSLVGFDELDKQMTQGPGKVVHAV